MENIASNLAKETVHPTIRPISVDSSETSVTKRIISSEIWPNSGKRIIYIPRGVPLCFL